MYSEVFRQNLPFYLAIGMTPNEYWNGDCCLVRYYREAHELKRRERNQDLWLQGLYVYEAICRVAPVLTFSPKKGAKVEPYPSEPYPLTETEVREKKEREEKKRYEENKAKMRVWMAAVNKAQQERGDKRE